LYRRPFIQHRVRVTCKQSREYPPGSHIQVRAIYLEGIDVSRDRSAAIGGGQNGFGAPLPPSPPAAAGAPDAASVIAAFDQYIQFPSAHDDQLYRARPGVSMATLERYAGELDEAVKQLEEDSSDGMLLQRGIDCLEKLRELIEREE
jgi:hypothetical protein